MSIFIIVFMIIATIFTIGTLGYVTVDIVLEAREKKKSREEKKEESDNATPPAAEKPRTENNA